MKNEFKNSYLSQIFKIDLISRINKPFSVLTFTYTTLQTLPLYEADVLGNEASVHFCNRGTDDVKLSVMRTKTFTQDTVEESSHIYRRERAFGNINESVLVYNVSIVSNSVYVLRHLSEHL